MANALALVTSLMWGFCYFLGGRLSTRISAYAVTAMVSGVTAIVFLALAVMQDQLSFDNVDVATGIVAGVTTLLGNLCLFTALTKGPMGIVSGITALLVVIPVIWSISLGDPLTAVALIGVILTVGGVILLGAREMSGTTTRLAIVLALLAAVFFGIQQVAIAQGSQDDSYVTLFLAQSFVVVTLGVLGLARRTTGGITRRSLVPLVVIGLANSIAFAAYAEATILGDPGLVSALASLDPVVVAILAFIVLKQRMFPIQIVALGTAIVGGAMISIA